MHLVAIRRDIYEKHPFVAASLYRALVAAKQHAMHKMRIQVSLRYMLPWLADHVARSIRCSAATPFRTASSPTGRP